MVIMKNNGTKGKKPYTAKNSYTSSDWNLAKPNTIYVGDKSAHYGNVFISVRKWTGSHMVAFRAGRELRTVHAKTIIQVGSDKKKQFTINTKRMYEYLHEKSKTGEIHLEMRDFGKCPNDAYKVNINDLVLYANIDDHPIIEDRLGGIA
jgi:hypothetical protein